MSYKVEKPKDPRRQLQGQISRAKGIQFESEIDRAFDYYKQTGYAAVEKTPEPMHIIQRLENGKFIACFEKKAQADYKGTIKGGRTVIYEAKYTSTDRIEQSRVSAEQTEYLDLHNELGARCFVICGFRSGAVFLVPWAVWRTMKEKFGHKYVTEENLKPYSVKRSWRGILELI